jgi:hypothetical protein
LLYVFGTSKSTAEYLLLYSLIFDSGTTLYIFNDLSRFYNLRKAPRDHFIVAGNSRIPILAYRDVNLSVKGFYGPLTLRLHDVAYYMDFQYNLVSFGKLQERGYYWDTRKNLLLRENETVLCQLNTIDGQQVLEHIPLNTHSHQSAFSAIRQRRRCRTTRDRRPDSAADGHLWHRRIGHIG